LFSHDSHLLHKFFQVNTSGLRSSLNLDFFFSNIFVSIGLNKQQYLDEFKSGMKIYSGCKSARIVI